MVSRGFLWPYFLQVMELQRSNMLNKPALHIQEVAMVLSHTQEVSDNLVHFFLWVLLNT